MKFLIDFEITENRSNADGSLHLLRLRALSPMPALKPGQFVNVEVPDSKTTFLRRPISICYAEKDELWLYIKDAGAGTAHLCAMAPGRKLNILLPLGNGFTMPEKPCRALLVGGGVGVAPLLMLAKELREKGCDTVCLLGARSAKDLFLLEEFRKYSALAISTEDGSEGEKGLVTQHSDMAGDYDKVYVCGPTPMMKAVAAVMRERSADCEVSLENKMACGVGACLCCVENTKDGHKCVCSDGPVFNIDELWT